MDEDGVTRTTRFDEWPDDGTDLLLRLAGWFGENAWLVEDLSDARGSEHVRITDESEPNAAAVVRRRRQSRDAD